jgi:hypothetical protein
MKSVRVSVPVGIINTEDRPKKITNRKKMIFIENCSLFKFYSEVTFSGRDMLSQTFRFGPSLFPRCFQFMLESRVTLP